MNTNAVAWRKASRSSSNGGNCVELARINGAVAIRDSKNPHGPKLLITPQALRDLTQIIKNA
ncbi:DUF397 domain-containing protein [Actinomadura formosensis]|uniref:DUF397 domain-containing protein n=1 Tax=Actinomadura formosensis TaxID=60706 RepID=UPI003D8E5E8F